VQNRLRWHLLELCPELERSLKRGSLAAARQLERIDRRLRRIGARARTERAVGRPGGRRKLNDADKNAAPAPERGPPRP
jgi:hypothetical protein